MIWRLQLCTKLFLVICGALAASTRGATKRFDATWESLDTRELPEWYDDAKFGIFVHWGPYSVPAIGSEWLWYMWKTLKDPNVVEYMDKYYPPTWDYPAFATQFKAAFFDPAHWARLFSDAGAKYVVLTSKHHDGYTLWPSQLSWNWNCEVGPGTGRDLVGELKEAMSDHAPHFRFGLYHSLYEWYNPMYLQDRENDYTTNDFVVKKTGPELYDIVHKYKPDVLWSDGNWEAPDTYWNSTDFLAWLYNDSPVRDTVVTNDRWGNNTKMKHGDFFSGEDRYLPGEILEHKWESCDTLDKYSWGYRRNLTYAEVLTIDECVQRLVSSVSTNGNFLLNVGPTADGVIPPMFEERLRQMGSWLRINGEAIYATRPWRQANDPSDPQNIWYTANKARTVIYAITLSWPKNGQLILRAPRKPSSSLSSSSVSSSLPSFTPPSSSPSPPLSSPSKVRVRTAGDGHQRQYVDADLEEMEPVVQRNDDSSVKESVEEEKVTLFGYEGAVSHEHRDGDKGGLVIDVGRVDFSKVEGQWAWVFKLTGFE